MSDRPEPRTFPIAAGILFGLGLGGFFDGIALHQLLQWHHMLSSWYPVNSVENLKLNTLWDGILHSTTYVFVVVGLFILWRKARTRHLHWCCVPVAHRIPPEPWRPWPPRTSGALRMRGAVAFGSLW